MFSSSRTLPGQSYCCTAASDAVFHALDPLAGALRVLADEVFDEYGDVLAPLAQRRDLDRDHVEPVEEILLELALGDELPQVAVGGGDHADVDALGALRPERLELALLQHAQQLRLQRGAERRDLVEQDRAAVGEGEPAFLVRHRTR